MPIYVYECAKGHQLEEWQGIKDPPFEKIEHSFFTLPKGHVICRAAVRRIIVPPGGYVMEPSGVYQPLPGMDPKTKRGREEKITKREYERRDRDLRTRMLATRERGLKTSRIDMDPPKRQSWF